MKNAIKTALIIVCALIMGLIGCATPQRHVSVTTWDGKDIQTQATSDETGWQLWVGERHTAAAGPGCMITDDVSKQTLGTVAITAIGAVAGAYAGGVPGMVIGGAGGAAVGALTGDKATTSTMATVVPIMGRISANSAAMTDADVVTNTILQGGAIQPELAALLKNYIAANPERCRLAQLIGVERVNELIDRLAAQSKGDVP